MREIIFAVENYSHTVAMEILKESCYVSYTERMFKQMRCI